MTGRHGMVRQLESLRDDDAVRDRLVLYLCHRAPGAEWADNFKEAAARYLSEPTDIALFGVLVRDVDPRVADLQSRARALGETCPDLTRIELTAAYFPPDSIDGLGRRVRLRPDQLNVSN